MQPKCAETHSNQQVKLGWQKNKHNKLQNIFDLNLQVKLSKKQGMIIIYSPPNMKFTAVQPNFLMG